MKTSLQPYLIVDMPTTHIHTNYRPTYGQQRQCTEPQCPLNGAGLHHNEGIYRHGGEDPTRFSSIFGTSNPPPFVWEAEERSIAAQKRLEAGDESARADVEEATGVVDKFLDSHCECAFSPH